ncbi:hypothetical protein IHQ71_15990 [Rhizobium sp. TH2]|uniref:hypothetical protein n=1 Tax=Rhizobium sp. TH2 TaxID=2775403 RepID=UPI0021586F1D|nr:hypothetical protein [Rhizobium sp. TH2]UVC06755.1 hypothetical protein IHQ71_15990 [Rhizobium sp. TH2]
MRSGIVLSAAALAGITIPAFAQASSPDAWKEFNAQVEQKCAEAAADMFRKPQVAVDPVGSENFGLAIVFGRSKDVKGRAAVVCVVNKKTGVVELGTEMSNDLVRVRKPKDDDKDDKDDGGQSGAD